MGKNNHKGTEAPVPLHTLRAFYGNLVFPCGRGWYGNIALVFSAARCFDGGRSGIPLDCYPRRFLVFWLNFNLADAFGLDFFFEEGDEFL